MKSHCAWILTASLVSPVLPVNGQNATDETGFELGIFRFQPIISALAAYDTRVIEVPAEADAYGEAEALLRMENTDARYDVGGWASYGYRAYDTYTELDDNFYGAGANLASREGRLKTGLSAYVTKTLDYDTRIDGDSDLPAILAASTSHRTSAKVDVGYERQLTEKSAIMPVYEGWYYYQDFEERPDDDAEWQEHSAILRFGYGMSTRMLLTLSGGYGMQINEEESGSIANVAIGAKSRATDKIDWSAELGVSSVDYELSGTDEGFVGSLNLNWQAADKVAGYVFGGSEFQPGGGERGARKIYRAGYGAVWSIVEKIKLDLQVLHDYEDSIQESATGGPDDVRNFVTGQMVYDINGNIALALTGSFIDDDEDDQTIISGRIVWSY